MQTCKSQNQGRIQLDDTLVRMRWRKDEDAILVVHQLGEVNIIDLDWESRNTVKGQLEAMIMIPRAKSAHLKPARLHMSATRSEWWR